MKTKEITLTATLLSLVMVLAPLTVPMGIVPFSMQTFIIPLVVCLLSRRNGVLLVTAYLLLGGFGLPIFANWSSGWAVFAGPTGGYLIGMLAFPFIIGNWQQAKKSWRMLTVKLLLAASLQLLFGGMWLAYTLQISWIAGLQIGVLPFVLMMLVKSAAVITVIKVMGKRKLLNALTSTVNTY